MNKVRARWVPKQLTEDQTAPRVTKAKDHLGSSNYNEIKILNCIATGAEMWIR